MSKPTLLQSLGVDVKRLRSEAELSQTEFAKLAELPQSRVTPIESGTVNLTVSSLQKIAAALKKSLEIRLK
ncbi:helix-turn-helix transcriptional regulator [Candidatus Bathyarchaeota archaeon]|nr:helix-turn-helix transcriptional regulator [Candidatus Bathyarchaeota archaeon]MBE3141451.1 helix-turn-helix transcriptional regulator [Thermoplasmata archaeon]